ncbi:MAG: hypothetical protein ABI787_00630 [Spartobacteria bacterium]
MSWTEFLANLKRSDQNAAVIFDQDEPIGRPTDLVMPRKRWFGRRDLKKSSPTAHRAAAPKLS